MNESFHLIKALQNKVYMGKNLNPDSIYSSSRIQIIEKQPLKAK